MNTRRWMWEGAAATLSLVLLAPAVGAQRGDPREQHAYATVTDKKGAAVSGLGAADFTVTEDGVKREILRVEPAAAPLQVALLLDSSDVVRAPGHDATHDVRLGATAFINAIFDANSLSQMALYTFGERPTPVAPFASTPIPILKAADSFFPAPGSGAYFNEAVRDASRALAKIDAKRPVIVAYVDENGPEFSNIDHTRVAEELQSSRAALWTISKQDRNAAGNPIDDTAKRERAMIVNDLTDQSGGENTPVFVTTTLSTTFTQLARLLGSQYDITYARPESMIPPRKIDVATSKPGTKLLAPHWSGK